MSETVKLDDCTFERRNGKWYDQESGGDWGPIVETSLFAYALTALADAQRTLAAEVERLKGEKLTTEEARANLILQTICRLPSVLTTDDWQDFLDEHRDEWLNDDRAFGGWVSQRLGTAIATARADAMREVREGVEKMERYDEGDYVALLRGDYLDRDEVLALLDATRGEA